MNHIKYWITLEQVQGIGPAHLQEIYSTLALKNLALPDIMGLTGAEISGETGLQPKLAEAICSMEPLLPSVENDYLDLLDEGVSIIPFFSGGYPSLLKTRLANSMPSFLYAKGNDTLLAQKGIAILGDRDVSPRGQKISFLAAQDLARHRIPVISGFATGVDLIAHRSSLINGGSTIAVLPYGIKHIRPHEVLRGLDDPDRFLLVSPFYPTFEANRFQAYIRNRVACALAYAVFIVEAPDDGGIFEAAKSAAKLKIPLYTAEYSSYPDNAKGNVRILDELGGIPVRGRTVDEMLVPNMDRIIAHAKFDTPSV